MDSFESLDVWKRSCRLCVEIYRALETCREFGFKDQITRAALSVPSNIAEGYERNTSKEYAHFLKIAKGSCGELRTQLYIGVELGLINKAKAKDYIKEATELAKMLQGIVKKLSLKTSK
ncbi:MAG: four helix bundle protein [Gammaproteobacteria bacterium]|nr:MAG: four helix bundle protein [Gammaproteobacteria bacterium]